MLLFNSLLVLSMKQSELKYTSKDTIKLIDIFAKLSETSEDKSLLLSELKKLTEYPLEVLEEFIKSIDSINIKNIKDNYSGIITYITMRINLVNMT